MQGSAKILQKAVSVLSQHPMCGAISPTARIHRSRDQRVKMGVAPLTITSRDPLAKLLLLFP